jgi:hypothetical protein
MGAGRWRQNHGETMPVKPLTKAETEELNGYLERAALRAEANLRRNPGSAEAARTLTGILAALDAEPREA